MKACAPFSSRPIRKPRAASRERFEEARAAGAFGFPARNSSAEILAEMREGRGMSQPVSLRKAGAPAPCGPMRAGDGLLVRLRVKGARLDLDQAEAIANCAARFGNGMIEISSRANLQLRGVDEAGLLDLQNRLGELGLLDADPAAEGVRNIIASPITDIDPAAIIDTTPIVTALEARVGDDESFRRLPPKFGFLIDGGGALPLGDVEADVRFEAWRDKEGRRFVVTLAGADDVAAHCALRDVPDAAAALARAFLQEAGAGDDAPRRMNRLVMREGARTVFAAAGLAPLAAPLFLRRCASRRGFLWRSRFRRVLLRRRRALSRPHDGRRSAYAVAGSAALFGGRCQGHALARLSS